MIYPKGMAAVAEANGIDLSGFGNPFPTDQLFPDYIADSTQGPQWGESGAYAGIKPGIPSMDVLDDYASSPMNTLKAVMGSVNPIFKIPAELATGHSMRTGAPIMDKSDYADQQIPLGTYIDKAAGGRSLSSGFSQENRVAASNQNYEGNPNMPPVATLINLLTGMGLTDYSKPSYQKSAQLDQRKRLASGG
jgi:hypothetical protein